MQPSVELGGEVEKFVERQLAELEADDSTWRTIRRVVLGTGGAGLAGIDSGGARRLWTDTSGA